MYEGTQDMTELVLSPGEDTGVRVPALVVPEPLPADPALERVAKALRGARARTGLSEELAVAILVERGVVISMRVLQRAEATGMLDLVLASHLADAYGTTTDCLAGRRPNRHLLSAAA
jgi:hypothetical protein